MTKNDLINALAEGTAISKTDIGAILDKLPSVIEATVKSGNPFTLPKVGIFKARESAARQARNPATGEKIQIAAKTVVKFKPSKSLSDAVA